MPMRRLDAASPPPKRSRAEALPPCSVSQEQREGNEPHPASGSPASHGAPARPSALQSEDVDRCRREDLNKLFRGCKVAVLEAGRGMGKRRAQTLSSIIAKHGGQVHDGIDDTTTHVVTALDRSAL